MTTPLFTPTQQKTRSIHNSDRKPGKIGIHQADIAGRFRRISAHQITMAWWLHISGNLSRRQLRVYFAAHEMHERRRYARQGSDDRRGQQARTHALYRVEEVAALVGAGQGGRRADGTSGGREGGGGAQRALASLRADIRHLARLGLVVIEPHSITFAVSIDEIRVDDISEFWTMFEQIPNARRTVPVPRRSLRALAGVGGLVGGSRGVTGVMLAMLIRSLFWHKESQSYRVDGRTKASWIVEVFGLSRRAVTDARTTLIELGWIESLDAPQWALNRWGSHDRINPDWSQPSPPRAIEPSTPSSSSSSTLISSSTPAARDPKPTSCSLRAVGEGAAGQPLVVAAAAEGSDLTPTHQTSHSSFPTAPYTVSATPRPDNNTGSASPCLNRYSSPTGNLNTRRLGANPPNPASRTGVSARNDQGKENQSAITLGSTHRNRGWLGSGKKKKLRKINRRVGGAKAPSTPNIRDIKLGHMQETADLLELYRQAIGIGLAKPSEAGRLDFLALAERAKAHGKRAGALFFWLLREKKMMFITQSEEDAAVTRIRALHNPDNRRDTQRERWGGGDHQQTRGSNPLGSGNPQQGRGLEPMAAQYTKDERFVLVCIRIAKQKRIDDPYRVAKIKEWSRTRWDKALESYQARQWAQLQHARSDENTDE